LSNIAFQLMPRYHFAANNGIFLNRRPFINYDQKLAPKHISRFVGIGAFPTEISKAKDKYLYAIKTTPLSSLGDKIKERPDDTTENPYVSLILRRRRDDKVDGKLKEDDNTEFEDIEEIF